MATGSHERNERERVNYWANGPLTGAAHPEPVRGQFGLAGVHGVDATLIIDIDESSESTGGSQPRFGYAPKGTYDKPRRIGPITIEGKKVNYLIAVDPNVGVLAYFIWKSEGGTTAPLFFYSWH